MKPDFVFIDLSFGGSAASPCGSDKGTASIKTYYIVRWPGGWDRGKSGREYLRGFGVDYVTRADATHFDTLTEVLSAVSRRAKQHGAWNSTYHVIRVTETPGTPIPEQRRLLNVHEATPQVLAAGARIMWCMFGLATQTPISDSGAPLAVNFVRLFDTEFEARCHTQTINKAAFGVRRVLVTPSKPGVPVVTETVLA